MNTDKARALEHYTSLASQAQATMQYLQSTVNGLAVPTLSSICQQMAEDHVLADVDTFAEELSAACMGYGRVSSEYESRRPDRLQAASTPTVLHALLSAGNSEDAQLALSAAKILVARYLDGQSDRVVARALLLESECDE